MNNDLTPRGNPSDQHGAPDNPPGIFGAAPKVEAAHAPSAIDEGEIRERKREVRESWNFYIQIATVAVLGIYTLFTGGLFLETIEHNQELSRMTSEALTESRRDMALTHRPWIADKAPIITGPLKVDSNGAVWLSVEIPVSNIGKSPALEVLPDVRLFGKRLVSGESMTELIDEQTKVCNSQAKFMMSESKPLGKTLFPNEETTFKLQLSLTGEQTAGAYAETEDGRKLLFVRATGCFSYRFPWDRSVHQTGISFAVMRSRAVGPQAGAIELKPGETIPASDLAVVPGVPGERFAN